MKSISTFELFTLIKEHKGFSFLQNNLQVHQGTMKRWEKLQQIPNYYVVTLKNILKQLSLSKKISNVKLNISHKKNRQFDEFYTKKAIAVYCLQVLKQQLQRINVNVKDFFWLEPSAGKGAFYDLMPTDKRLGIEINPHLHHSYLIQDYLQFKPNLNHKYLVLGNPPFGLRGNLALKFINHSYQFADICAFILPPLFTSDGKGNPKNRIQPGYRLLHSEALPLDAFEYPDGKTVKIATVFQIWLKIKHHLLPKSTMKTTNKFIKIYSLSDGGTPSTTRNKKMLNNCDLYLPSTCFQGMKCYFSFHALPNKRGYGIRLLKSPYQKQIYQLLTTTNWKKTAFLSTNSALNLRMSIIHQVLINAGFYDQKEV